MMNYQVTGAKLEHYLSERGIAADDFCKQMHLNVAVYDKIVRGEKVGLVKLFVLAHKIGLTLNDFLA